MIGVIIVGPMGQNQIGPLVANQCDNFIAGFECGEQVTVAVVQNIVANSQQSPCGRCFLAADAGLEIVPVLNKIDLPGAEPERRRAELADLLGVDPDTILAASAKKGVGIEAILEAVVQRVPPPQGDPAAPLRALIFDSYYDQYLGAVPSVRVCSVTSATVSSSPPTARTIGTVPYFRLYIWFKPHGFAEVVE